jgi:hypothetical protein
LHTFILIDFEDLIKICFLSQLAFWDELNDEQRQQLFAELNDLDLDDVTKSFRRCLNIADDQKLDDRMSPLPSHIYGSILTATNQVKLNSNSNFTNIKLLS